MGASTSWCGGSGLRGGGSETDDGDGRAFAFFLFGFGFFSPPFDFLARRFCCCS